MKVRAYRDGDWPEWLRMSLALFPECSSENLAAGMRDFRGRDDAQVFVVEREDIGLAGFVEVEGPAEPGDLLLLKPGPAQVHLAIVGRMRMAVTPARWGTSRRGTLMPMRDGHAMGARCCTLRKTGADKEDIVRWRPTHCWRTR